MLADEMESESDNDDTVLSDDTKEQKAIPKTPVKVEVQVILLQDSAIREWRMFLEKGRAISEAQQLEIIERSVVRFIEWLRRRTCWSNSRPEICFQISI